MKSSALSRRSVALGLVSCALSLTAAADALPTGGTVTAGSATFAESANSLVVNVGTDRAAINWQSFSIGAGNSVQFVQPQSSSAVLNRVVSADPSSIYGTLTSNGRVFLVNPNGIVVGAGGRIEASGIFLSTANISDADFMDGNLRFEEPPAGVSIVSEGELNAVDGVEIRASTIEQMGTIVAPGGIVLLATDNTLGSASVAVSGGDPPTLPTLSTTPPVMPPASDTSGTLSGTLPMSASIPLAALGVRRVPLPTSVLGGRLVSSPAPQPTVRMDAPTVPPPARSSAAVVGAVNVGALVDGAVTVRMPLVDATPIMLR